jgi:hypothetical protein
MSCYKYQNDTAPNRLAFAQRMLGIAYVLALLALLEIFAAGAFLIQLGSDIGDYNYILGLTFFLIFVQIITSFTILREAKRIREYMPKPKPQV